MSLKVPNAACMPYGRDTHAFFLKGYFESTMTISRKEAAYSVAIVAGLGVGYLVVRHLAQKASTDEIVLVRHPGATFENAFLFCAVVFVILCKERFRVSLKWEGILKEEPEHPTCNSPLHRSKARRSWDTQ